MNKRTMIALSAVGLILTALLAVLLIGKGSWIKTAGTTTAAAQSAEVPDVRSEPTVQDSTDAPTDFTIAAGVGNKEDWGLTDTVVDPSENAEQTHDQQTSQTAQPSQGGQSGTALEPTDADDADHADDGMPDVMLTYEAFIQMSEDEQDEYFLQFDDPRDYAAWLKAAKKEYEDNQFAIVITGPIDLSTLPTDGNE